MNHYVFSKNILGFHEAEPINQFRIPHLELTGELPLHFYSRLCIWGAPCYPITDAYFKNFDLRTFGDCIWVGLSTKIKGALVYSFKKNDWFVAGMLRVYQGVDKVGRLLKLPALNDDDLTCKTIMYLENIFYFRQ